MDQLMYLLAPKGAFGFVIRLIVLITIVAAANISFALRFDDQADHFIGYYFAQAFLVGGPFITFFLAVSVFQIRLQRRLWRLARKDGLTGLNNRRTFLELMTKAREATKDGFLLMLDADSFKNINDTYGHNAGDQCLKSTSHTLRTNLRDGEIVGRIGGEEFAIYLPNATVAQVQRIGTRLTEPISFNAGHDHCIAATLSIGATQSCDTASNEDLFAQADHALYRAKNNGKAQMVIYDPNSRPDEVAEIA